MRDETYNGWTNYATWRVNLENIDGLDPREIFEYETTEELACLLSDYLDEHISENSSGIAKDYARAFLADVDWRQIAAHLVEDYPRPAADEETEEESDNG